MFGYDSQIAQISRIYYTYLLYMEIHSTNVYIKIWSDQDVISADMFLSRLNGMIQHIVYFLKRINYFRKVFIKVWFA